MTLREASCLGKRIQGQGACWRTVAALRNALAASPAAAAHYVVVAEYRDLTVSVSPQHADMPRARQIRQGQGAERPGEVHKPCVKVVILTQWSRTLDLPL